MRGAATLAPLQATAPPKKNDSIGLQGVKVQSGQRHFLCVKITVFLKVCVTNSCWSSGLFYWFTLFITQNITLDELLYDFEDFF